MNEMRQARPLNECDLDAPTDSGEMPECSFQKPALMKAIPDTQPHSRLTDHTAYCESEYYPDEKIQYRSHSRLPLW
jgi:hypothetical protein